VVNFIAISRENNEIEDSLVMDAITFKPPDTTLLKFEIEIMHRLSIPNNIKHWKIFGNNQ